MQLKMCFDAFGCKEKQNKQNETECHFNDDRSKK